MDGPSYFAKLISQWTEEELIDAAGRLGIFHGKMTTERLEYIANQRRDLLKLMKINKGG